MSWHTGEAETTGTAITTAHTIVATRAACIANLASQSSECAAARLFNRAQRVAHQTRTRFSGGRYIFCAGVTPNAAYQASRLRTVAAR